MTVGFSASASYGIVLKSLIDANLIGLMCKFSLFAESSDHMQVTSTTASDSVAALQTKNPQEYVTVFLFLAHCYMFGLRAHCCNNYSLFFFKSIIFSLYFVASDFECDFFCIIQVLSNGSDHNHILYVFILVIKIT